MSGLTALTDLDPMLAARFTPAAAAGDLGLAVSGGADSLALLLLAAAWQQTLAAPPRLFVYTVDHGLRPEAAAEAEFVLRTAATLGLEARALRWRDVKPAAGVQAAARAARYRLMGEAMRADGAALLLTAHHAHDQAETVLMRLAHGSGLEGLRGMDAFAVVEGTPVFRPLLDVAPEALRAVVAAAGLTPMLDPSNADRHYERVRWRQAAPQLAELGLDGASLGRFARRAGEADAALSMWAATAFGELVETDALGALALPQAGFAALPPAVATRLLGRVLEAAGGRPRPHDLEALERLHLDLRADAGASRRTMLGVQLGRRGSRIWFSREPGRRPVTPAVIGAAQSLVWDGRFRIANRLGVPVDVRMAGALSRQAAERLVGRRLDMPAAAIRSAPLVSAPDGAMLALGSFRLGDGVAVDFVGGRGHISSL